MLIPFYPVQNRPELFLGLMCVHKDTLTPRTAGCLLPGDSRPEPRVFGAQFLHPHGPQVPLEVFVASVQCELDEVCSAAVGGGFLQMSTGSGDGWRREGQLHLK